MSESGSINPLKYDLISQSDIKRFLHKIQHQCTILLNILPQQREIQKLFDYILIQTINDDLKVVWLFDILAVLIKIISKEKIIIQFDELYQQPKTYDFAKIYNGIKYKNNIMYQLTRQALGMKQPKQRDLEKISAPEFMILILDQVSNLYMNKKAKKTQIVCLDQEKSMLQSQISTIQNNSKFSSFSTDYTFTKHNNKNYNNLFNGVHVLFDNFNNIIKNINIDEHQHQLNNILTSQANLISSTFKDDENFQCLEQIFQQNKYKNSQSNLDPSILPYSRLLHQNSSFEGKIKYQSSFDMSEKSENQDITFSNYLTDINSDLSFDDEIFSLRIKTLPVEFAELQEQQTPELDIFDSVFTKTELIFYNPQPQSPSQISHLQQKLNQLQQQYNELSKNFEDNKLNKQKFLTLQKQLLTHKKQISAQNSKIDILTQQILSLNQNLNLSNQFTSQLKFANSELTNKILSSTLKFTSLLQDLAEISQTQQLQFKKFQRVIEKIKEKKQFVSVQSTQTRQEVKQEMTQQTAPVQRAKSAENKQSLLLYSQIQQLVTKCETLHSVTKLQDTIISLEKNLTLEKCKSMRFQQQATSQRNGAQELRSKVSFLLSNNSETNLLLSMRK